MRYEYQSHRRAHFIRDGLELRGSCRGRFSEIAQRLLQAHDAPIVNVSVQGRPAES
jgi:hypothetical protein